MPAGRPRIYNDPDDLEKAVESYFNVSVIIEADSFAGKKKVITNVTEPNPKPTVTGLALHLGFADKTTLYEYRDRPEFSYPIKRALTMIEEYHEKALSENNVTGRIFALKNMGWKDKTDIEHSGNATFNVIMESSKGCDPLPDGE